MEALRRLYFGDGQHLFGAPIHVFKNLVGLSQSNLALDQSQIALTSYSKSDRALDNFAMSRMIWLTRIKARLPSTWGPLMRFGTMGTTSPGLDIEEQGGTHESSYLT
jgi:hypothetical protein